MRRREFLAGVGAGLAAPLVRAQPAARMATLGLLFPNPTGGLGLGSEYIERLRELGWEVGRNLKLEIASAEGQESRLPALAAALVDRKVDVIWVAGPEAALAAARATDRIPIAFYGVGFPVEQGLVDSLQRPGRNVTGLAALAGSERAKQVEFLREIAPKATHLAWIRTETTLPTLSGGTVRISREDVTSAGAKLGFQVQRFGVARREDFDVAFAEIQGTRAQALIADFTALTWRERQRIVDFAIRQRLPSVFGASDFVAAGGLLSYGASRLGMQLQSFGFIDRLLRGAKPAELPVELPSRLELAVNLRTAAALALKVPQSVLLRADRAIE